MRQYQVEIRIPIPILLASPDQTNDPNALFRFLNDFMTDVSIAIHEQAQTIIQTLHDQAAEKGFDLKVPDLKIPMGVGCSISDRTSQVGQRWTEKE